MLNAFIIDQIQRQEQQRERPHLRVPSPSGWEPEPGKPEEEVSRGVIIIDYGDDEEDDPNVIQF